MKPPILLLYNLNPTWPAEDIETTRSIATTFLKALEGEGYFVIEACLENKDLKSLLKRYDPGDVIVFNWCEELPGVPHSYDLIARTLESSGFTFTGADSAALAFSQDKRKVKECLTALGISTPGWKIVTSTEDCSWASFPAIVKPVLEHCSYGITSDAIVYSQKDLTSRVDYVLRTFHQAALIEDFIDGREFHVTVVGNGKLHALPAAEMDFSAFVEAKQRLCSYESKFDPNSTAYNLIKLKLPANLTDEEQFRLNTTAIDAYRAVGCRDYARLDIRLKDGIFYVLDVNPNADISPDTSLVLAAEQAGLSYGQLGSLFIQLASLRHPVFSRSYGEAIHIPVDAA